LLGEASFASFVEQRIVVRTQSRALAHPHHPHAGRALIAFPRADGGHYGVSEDDDVLGALLPPGALEAWRLDPLALGRHVARDLSLEGRARAVERVEGLVELGFRNIGPVEVRVFMAAARPMAKALEEVIATLPGKARAVVLAPRGRHLAAAPVAPFEPAAPNEGLLRDVVLALRLDDEVEAILLAPAGTRFVVDTRRDLVWLDGVPLVLTGTDLVLSTALAKANGASVSWASLAKAIGAGPRDGGALPKQKHHLLASIREELERAGREAPKGFDRLIESGGKQGYRLTIPAFVR
jgi:hypothetical protein